MCFSVEASFAAGTVLTIAGIASIKKVRSRSQILFASIPIVFAIQQFMEGFVWLSISGTAFVPWLQPLMYIYLIFAQVVWPTLVPLAILLLEKDKKRKFILYIFLAIGIFLSGYLTIGLINNNITATVVDYHISYTMGYTESVNLYVGILYLISTIFTTFVSSTHKMKFLGLLILSSFIISRIFFAEYLLSVCCFFAAIISIVVYSVITDHHKATEDESLTSLVE